MYSEAGFENFLKSIFIIIALWFIVRFILRMSFPFLVRYLQKIIIRKITSSFEQMNNSTYNSNYTPENKQKTEKTKVGEYIDYEELD